MMPPLVRHVALFLDVDGTLVDIAARPEDVRADAALRAQLARLATRLDGAVALVSGRPIAELDRLFEPLQLPVAGLHGVERRGAAGVVERVVTRAQEAALAAARVDVQAFVAAHPGLVLEDKGAGLAVHYRAAPHLERAVHDEMQRRVAAAAALLELQLGLLVCELKPRGADKGTAVQAFMVEAPFAGRRPVAVGDDFTDLHAFRAAETLGGFGVAVGGRVGAACRLPGPRAVRAWLTRLAEAPAEAG